MLNDSFLMPSKKSVRRAGELLRTPNLSGKEVDDALDILSKWRACYYRPINTIKRLVQKRLDALGVKSPIVAQRLKRTPSIITKLQRHKSMQLDRMQDIGGIRAIVNNVEEVRKVHEALIAGRHRHKPVTLKDYIAEPKKDGYRGIHQVFKYHGPEQFNGMLVEVQIRTKLQHCWATAVETLGVIERCSFKTGEGNDKYDRFFQLSSALFSIYENEPVVASLRDKTQQDIAREFRALEHELGVFSKLEGFTLGVQQGYAPKDNDRDGYYLLVLRRETKQVMVMSFPKQQAQLAAAAYGHFEKGEKYDPAVDIVLVASGDMKDLKKAYPNYFSDTREFVKKLKMICEDILK